MFTYKIYSKKIGVKNLQEVFLFNTVNRINCICAYNNNFYFADADGIKVIKKNNVSYSVTSASTIYRNVSSLFIDKNIIYAVEDGGSQIKKISVNDFYSSDMLSCDSLLECKKLFSKNPYMIDVVTNVCVNKYGYVYWTVDKLHRCLVIKNGMFYSILGTGRSGYCVSNKLNECMLSFPVGVTCSDNGVIMSDTCNNCIRLIENDTCRTIITNINKPRNVKFYNGKVFFISENCIFSLDEKYKLINQPIYDGKNIFDFFYSEKCFYIVQEEV